MDKPYLTAGETARLLHVSTNTIWCLFDTGRLHGFRIPYSRHRRICRKALIQFLAEHDIPLPEELRSDD